MGADPERRGFDERDLVAPITGATRLFAIIGDPVAQVRSPQTFNALFMSRGYDAVLIPVQVTAAEIDDVLPQLKRIRNLDGIVVTVPHKLAAIRHADWLLPDVDAVGAVNALARQDDGRWAGGMFDGQGFLTGLLNDGFAPRKRRAFIVGAGGVGRSIAFALAGAGVAALSLHDIDQQRVRSLARTLAKRYPDVRVDVVGGDPPECDLAVNATPLGMQPDDALPFDLVPLPPSVWIADVVMKPDVTPLIAAARASGHRAVLGRRVLENEIVALAEFFRIPDRR